jgi:predicted MFS family arabinose efflux permease
MQRVAQAWLISTLAGSRSALFLGLDSFLGELPLLLFTMLGGVVADRRDRRHMILTSQIVQLLVALALAALVVADQVKLGYVLTLSFVTGCVRAFGGPAYQSLLPSLVGETHLPNAIALNSIQDNLARIVGPIVAGVALSTLGMAACFGLNAVSFLFVIAAVLSLRDVHVPPTATETMAVQFASGLRYFRRSPGLMTVTALSFSGAFLGLPLLTFLPVMTRDVFHGDAAFYTRLMSFSGVGALTGALVVAWMGKSKHMSRTLLIVLVLFGISMIGFAQSRTIYTAAPILFIAGALLVLAFSLTTSLAQLLAPTELRGRLVSIYLVAFLGGSPLGSLTSGWLVTQVGSAPTMLIVNGAALAAIALCFLFRARREPRP